MTYPEFLALAGALLTSLLGLTYRGLIRCKEDGVLLAFWNSAAGGIVLAAVVTFPGLGSISSAAGFYLLASGLLWTAMVYCDLRAYGSMDLSLNALLNSLRLVLSVMIGASIFGESLSTGKIAGIVLILAALWVTARKNQLSFRSGAARILAVACGTAALAIDKHLSQTISIELILMNGYLIPTIFFAIYGMQIILFRPAYTPERVWKIALSSVLMAGSGYGLIVALGRGQLGTTMILNQMTLVFSFLIGVIFLRERTNLTARTIAVILAVAGAILTVSSA